MNKPLFKLVALEEAEEFINGLPPEVIRKIFYNIDKVIGGVKDPDLFKKLGDTEIWEFRTICHSMAYRLFAFWDKDGETLVVATHGLIKKTQKTPIGEIRKALKIRKEYFDKKKLIDMARITATFEELKNRHLGEVGTPERDAYEAEVREAIHTYQIGEAIKAARKEKNMTQGQLAELMGVKKAQVSRIERGENPTINTITRAFNALGMTVSLICGNIRISLG